MPGDEVLHALIDLRDFVAQKFEGTDARLSNLEREVRTGFDRIDRRLERLESRIEDIETRPRT